MDPSLPPDTVAVSIDGTPLEMVSLEEALFDAAIEGRTIENRDQLRQMVAMFMRTTIIRRKSVGQTMLVIPGPIRHPQ